MGRGCCISARHSSTASPSPLFHERKIAIDRFSRTHMNPGPAPVPTEIKKLMGNPGRRPLNDAEPRVTAAKLSVPRSLTEPNARKLYRECAKFLAANGLLGTVDTQA